MNELQQYNSIDIILQGTKSLYTSKNYKSVFYKFLSEINKPIEAITYNDVLLWIQGQNDKISSVNTKIRILKSIFKSLKNAGVIKNNVFELVKTYNIGTQPESNYLTDDDIKKLYNAIDNDRDRAIISILLYTGIRISELYTLQQQHDDNGYYIFDVIGKGNKKRSIKISPEIKKYIDFWDKNKISIRAIEKMVSKLAKTAGIGKKITPHSFRHTFITNAYKNNIDIFYIQEAVGHSSPEITRKYTHDIDIINNSPSDKLSYNAIIRGDNKQK